MGEKDENYESNCTEKMKQLAKMRPWQWQHRDRPVVRI